MAGGKVFVAAVDRHTVHALEATSGQRIWQYTAGGRVDSPPTIAGNLAVFGCADGYVYCLNLDGGQLVWRFRAAPTDRRTVSFGSVESVWPVTGSVLIREGVVYCTAGRSSFLDGGMYLYRLDLSTGKLLGETRFDDRDPQTLMQREETVEDVELPGALPDVLVDDGQYIYLRDKVLDHEGVEQDLHLPHLYCSAGLLDDNGWHRGGGTLEMSAKQCAAFNSINRCCSFRAIFGPSFLMDSFLLLQIFCSLFVLKYITISTKLQ